MLETNYLENPRAEMEKMINSGDTKGLLKQAAQLHGHFCPFLSIGVRAGFAGIKTLNVKTKGMEDVLAILETNNCFSDGVQMVTGCSFGNNSLIYRDFGKTAASIVTRDGNGIRIAVKMEEDWLEKNYPKASRLFEKVVVKRQGSEEENKELQKRWQTIAFAMLDIPQEEIFQVQDIHANIPRYAPIMESIRCSRCGEMVMESKVVEKEAHPTCIPCSAKGYYQLDGEGIACSQGVPFGQDQEKQSFFKLQPVGYVESRFTGPAHHEQMRREESIIHIYPQYEQGLYRIEESDFLNVIFYFHRSSGYSLKGRRHQGEIKGVFASRSPYRPSPVGLSRVRLLHREKNRLRVKGLDAVDGTPVLDIKPYAEPFDGWSVENGE
ncbi:MAG: tRNA (N6-threonylcarbamoyladenosine(37)-N6)-methyltransferase TrmO [Spirochaetota bacterium]